MNTQPNPVAPVDEADDWEPPQCNTPEDMEAVEASIIQLGGTVDEPRIRPNRWLGEK